MPCVKARLAISRASAAELVVWSIRILPGDIAASAPVLPSTTSRTWSSLPTQQNTNSAPRAALCGETAD
jgi:hypothetical protein